MPTPLPLRMPPALPPRPKVILFDVNETLLDMQKLKRAITKAFGNKFAFTQWFGLLLQYSLVDTVTGHYHPFNRIGDAALDMVADKLEKKRLLPVKKQEILALMSQLPAHKDVPQGLAMLQQAGFRLVAFTNSPRQTLEAQLRYAELHPYFERTLTIDPGQRYKPYLYTYQAAAAVMGVAPAEALLIAAHGWDVAGALHAGLSAGFIARPGQCLYPLAPPPTYSGNTLVAIAEQLMARPA